MCLFEKKGISDYGRFNIWILALAFKPKYKFRHQSKMDFNLFLYLLSKSSRKPTIEVIEECQ